MRGMTKMNKVLIADDWIDESPFLGVICIERGAGSRMVGSERNSVEWLARKSDLIIFIHVAAVYKKCLME